MREATRTARRIIRERAAATRLTASLKRGRALATHVLAAGVTDVDAVAGMANGLRSVAKRLGVRPVKAVRRHRTVRGKEERTRTTYHYTTAQVSGLLRAYNPRKAAYIEAKTLMVLAEGAPVTVRQAVRPAKARELVDA